MGKKPRVSRNLSILGETQSIGLTLPKAFHQIMDEIAVDCAFGSKTEVIRNSLIMLHGVVQMAKTGQKLGTISNDGTVTIHYGTVYLLVSKKAQQAQPTTT